MSTNLVFGAGRDICAPVSIHQRPIVSWLYEIVGRWTSGRGQQSRWRHRLVRILRVLVIDGPCRVVIDAAAVAPRVHGAGLPVGEQLLDWRGISVWLGSGRCRRNSKELRVFPDQVLGHTKVAQLGFHAPIAFRGAQLERLKEIY